MWLKKLKSALITKDVNTISTLLDDVPSLSSDELKEASFLLEEAAKVATQLRDEIGMKIQKVQKNRDFLDATSLSQQQHLNITL